MDQDLPYANLELNAFGVEGFEKGNLTLGKKVCDLINKAKKEKNSQLGNPLNPGKNKRSTLGFDVKVNYAVYIQETKNNAGPVGCEYGAKVQLKVTPDFVRLPLQLENVYDLNDLEGFVHLNSYLEANKKFFKGQKGVNSCKDLESLVSSDERYAMKRYGMKF